MTRAVKEECSCSVETGMAAPRIGLLPLYVELYDKLFPDLVHEFDPFLSAIERAFAAEGVAIVRPDVCRVKKQVDEAVRKFEKAEVDLIVSLHLAYSPSLESAEVLAATSLPLLFLDTTMDYAFGPNAKFDRMMFNHGIHGVQDLASVLLRLGKEFQIVAGHVSQSPVIHRAAEIARAARAANSFRNLKALRIGRAFAGMGDFVVDEKLLREKWGITVSQIPFKSLAADARAVTQSQVDREVTEDRRRYAVDLDEETHRSSVRAGLAVRHCLERKGITAFSMNFVEFTPFSGMESFPFAEASKAMAHGIGYAGEGDILSAALVRALSAGFGRTTFAEIFCPDWKNNALFLSHMGEINPNSIADKARLCRKSLPFIRGKDPAVLVGALDSGPVTLANLAPGPGGRFSLIAAQMNALPAVRNASMRDAVRGWVRPERPLPEFLEMYSRLGGTHHSALTFGFHSEALAALAQFLGVEFHAL